MTVKGRKWEKKNRAKVDISFECMAKTPRQEVNCAFYSNDKGRAYCDHCYIGDKWTERCFHPQACLDALAEQSKGLIKRRRQDFTSQLKKENNP